MASQQTFSIFMSRLAFIHTQTHTKAEVENIFICIISLTFLFISFFFATSFFLTSPLSKGVNYCLFMNKFPYTLSQQKAS